MTSAKAAADLNERAAHLARRVRKVVEETPVFDIHTHLYDPAFGELLLWGIDDLLTYHYLIAEAFRWLPMSAEKFWALDKSARAELIWNELFVAHSPISEACRGVITTLHALGFDVRKRDLPLLRRQYAQWNVDEFITRALELARVRQICMTNSPFDPIEHRLWQQPFARDTRFVAALRIDPLLLDWQNTAPILHRWGYEVRADFSGKTFDEVRRFLADWTKKIDARYCMVSLPPEFAFPAETPEARLISEAIMPHGREHGQAFALMIGVRRNANPELQLAGDSVGPADVSAVERLCAAFPQNRFLCTMLARENQHALCVAARKFRNLHVFGCWWFLNNPSLIDEITRMRMELIGLSCTPQHSDCRVLDQLIYKWEHSRRLIADVLADKYADLARAGWEPSESEIRRDVADLFGGAFEQFLAR
jgi:hypothetical protein